MREEIDEEDDPRGLNRTKRRLESVKDVDFEVKRLSYQPTNGQRDAIPGVSFGVFEPCALKIPPHVDERSCDLGEQDHEDVQMRLPAQKS